MPTPELLPIRAVPHPLPVVPQPLRLTRRTEFRQLYEEGSTCVDLGLVLRADAQSMLLPPTAQPPPPPTRSMFVSLVRVRVEVVEA